MARGASALLGLVCIGLALYGAAHVAWADVARAIARADDRWLAAALALVPVLLVLRTWRLAVLVERTTRDVFAPQMVSSLFGAFTPGNVGELSKVVLLRQSLGVRWTRAMCAFAVERVAEALVLFGLAAAFFIGFGRAALAGLAGMDVTELGERWAVGGALVLLAVASAVLAHPGVRRLVRRWLGIIAKGFPGTWRCGASGLGSAAVWGLEGGLLGLILTALGPSQAPGWLAPVLAAAVLCGTLSAAPAGVGAFDLVLTAGLGLVGYTSAVAVAALLLYRVISMGLPALVALGCVWRLSPRQPVAPPG